MDQAEAERVRWQVCGRKQPLGREAAARVCAESPALRSYRCPFCSAYHVGHVPAMAQVREIADAVRWFATGFSREEVR